MEQTYEVVLEKTAVHSIATIAAHLTYQSDCRYAKEPELAALEKTEALIDDIEEHLSTRPLASPISTYLAEVGVTDYRELLVGQYRVWFKVYPDRQVSIYVIAHQRQDLERLLVDYCLFDF